MDNSKASRNSTSEKTTRPALRSTREGKQIDAPKGASKAPSGPRPYTVETPKPDRNQPKVQKRLCNKEVLSGRRIESAPEACNGRTASVQTKDKAKAKDSEKTAQNADFQAFKK